MDAVAENGLFTQNAVILQPLNRAAAVVLQGIVHVVHAFGDMNVVAGAAVVGLDHAVKGLVGDGEQCVTAEHGCEHRILALLTLGDEVGIFLNGLQALFLAVAVGDFIAQAGADAEFLGGFCDGVQAAGNLAVGGVVVKNGGHALLDAVNVKCVGRSAGTGQREPAVDGPPCAVKHLVEVCWIIAHDGQATRQSGIDVRMCVDERGHDDAALGIDELSLGVLGLQIGGFADFLDPSSVDDDAAVGQIATGGVTGDELTVCENIHDVDLLRIKTKWGCRTLKVQHLHSSDPE